MHMYMWRGIQQCCCIPNPQFRGIWCDLTSASLSQSDDLEHIISRLHEVINYSMPSEEVTKVYL